MNEKYPDQCLSGAKEPGDVPYSQAFFIAHGTVDDPEFQVALTDAVFECCDKRSVGYHQWEGLE